MGVAKFLEQCAYGDGFLSIDIGGAEFGFGRRSNDIGHDFGHSVNGPIGRWRVLGGFVGSGELLMKK